jgi:hypothetical protein
MRWLVSTKISQTGKIQNVPGEAGAKAEAEATRAKRIAFLQNMVMVSINSVKEELCVILYTY